MQNPTPRHQHTKAHHFANLMVDSRHLAVALILLMSVAEAAKSATVMPLVTADVKAIEASLGYGTLGEPQPTGPIDDPSRWFPLKSGTQIYRIAQGSQAGAEQTLQLLKAATDNKAPWDYRIGEEEVAFLRSQTDGSLVIDGVEDRQAESLTRYDPPEPFLIKGLAPGEQRQTRMSVKVFAANDPNHLTHEGNLVMTFRHLGTHRLTVPAGTFDVVVTKSTFSGRVGPAQLEDTQYRFFAPSVGLVASIENRQVSAFVVYQTDTMNAKVLAQPPK